MSKGVCKFLLENGCDVNARNATGNTPLFFAGEGLHKKVAQVGCCGEEILSSLNNAFKIDNFRIIYAVSGKTYKTL